MNIVHVTEIATVAWILMQSEGIEAQLAFPIACKRLGLNREQCLVAMRDRIRPLDLDAESIANLDTVYSRE